MRQKTSNPTQIHKAKGQVLKGFTLIEVLTVIIIIGILSTLTVYVYNSSLIRSRDYQRLTDMQTIKNGLEQFYLDARHYPLLGENSEDLLLAKFQLEEYPACDLENENEKKEEYLAPRFLSSVPEDPSAKFIPSEGPGVGSGCESATGQAGHYLYIPNVPVSSGRESTPPGFFLIAKMEKQSNMSKSAVTVQDVGEWGGLVTSTGMVFCHQTLELANCTHNYYLTEAKTY